MSFSCGLFYTGSQKIDPIKTTGKIGVELRAIQKLYNKPDCYYARYTIQGINSDGTSHSANGIIRADNINNRMMMEFSVPFIGYKLSRIIIKNKKVYINDLYNNKKQNVALETFALGGLTKSQILLPFYIFQDILYARLPDKIYSTIARRSINGDTLQVQWKSGYEQYEYSFKARRLKSIKYLFAFEKDKQDIEISLFGQYQGSSFPSRINVISKNIDGKPDQLKLAFKYIQTKSSCNDSHFQVN